MENPDGLKEKIVKSLDLDLDISPFNCLAVEIEADKMDWKKVKNGFDPFADNENIATVKDGVR